MKKGLLVLCVLLSGCDLYFGGDDDPCEGISMGGGPRPTPPAQEVRDPNTGVCTYQGYDGTGCVNECGPCPLDDQPAIAVDWAACYGSCYDLDESTCFATSGCYAAYVEDPAADGKRDFWGCWNTAPSGPVQGACDNLDAYGCSRHDNCIAVYTGTSDATNTAYEGTKFLRCLAEQNLPAHCTDNTQCGPNLYCDTSTWTCQSVPDAACTAILAENACIARTDCQPLYEGTDCTCDSSGCHCQTYTFTGCESL
jgi:hypothetical protein